MRQVIPIGWLGVLGLGLLAGCEEPVAAPDAFELLSRREQLIRLSMDLRGNHPTEQELAAFEASDSAVEDWDKYVDTWIEDPRFIDRVKEIYNQRLLVKTGDVYFDASEAGLGGIDERVLAGDIADEVLALLEYTVVNELPYSTMVTADHSMANPTLAQYWGMEYPADANGGWTPALYEDGRPHAGMLTMSTTWQRYPSMGGNANRHRANAISKMFLCDDYLSRPIVLNRAAVDQLTIDPENAISVNSGCQSCHSSLDPLAANFFGFFNYDPEDGIESTRYRPENEEEWRYFAGKEPGYYGTPTGNIPEFARKLAADSRFTDCAVRTAWEGLTQRTMIDEDWPEVSIHRDLFAADDDMNVKDLFRSIVSSESYKAVAAVDPEVDERFVGRKIASPEQLSELFQQVTGYTWLFDGRDGLRNNSLGLPVLAGGIDSRFVTTRATLPTVGMVFVQERLAQSAAYFVAQHDLDPGRTDEAKLLLFVTVNDTPESNPEAFEQQIRYLYLVVTGVPLPEGATEPTELVATWKYLYSVDASPTTAWAGVLSAVLRDPRVLFY
ncbi:MAG: hypothetical protein ABMA64_11295 [Myxococcota bacterium]